MKLRAILCVAGYNLPKTSLSKDVVVGCLVALTRPETCLNDGCEESTVAMLLASGLSLREARSYTLAHP